MKLAITLTLVAAFAVACGGGNTLTGTFTLFSDDLTPACEGSGGYSDIRSGIDVLVKDGSGTILATSRLEAGRYDSSTFNRHCTYPFTVADVPEATIYSIEVGRRGALTYSKGDLDARDWTVGFELGR